MVSSLPFFPSFLSLQHQHDHPVCISIFLDDKSKTGYTGCSLGLHGNLCIPNQRELTAREKRDEDGSSRRTSSSKRKEMKTERVRE